jgi:hypothetical protein
LHYGLGISLYFSTLTQLSLFFFVISIVTSLSTLMNVLASPYTPSSSGYLLEKTSLGNFQADLYFFYNSSRVGQNITTENFDSGTNRTFYTTTTTTRSTASLSLFTSSIHLLNWSKSTCMWLELAIDIAVCVAFLLFSLRLFHTQVEAAKHYAVAECTIAQFTVQVCKYTHTHIHNNDDNNKNTPMIHAHLHSHTERESERDRHAQTLTNDSAAVSSYLCV